MIKKFRVTVDGTSYDVTAEVPDAPAAAPAPVKKASTVKKPAAAASAPSAPTSTGSAAQPGDVVSPLAGRVVAIVVEAGTDVTPGQHVLTLEAMKMNTFVFAARRGKIKEIKTEVGASVHEGQVLMSMEQG